MSSKSEVSSSKLAGLPVRSLDRKGRLLQSYEDPLLPRAPRRYYDANRLGRRGRLRRRCAGRFASAHVIVCWMCRQRVTGSYAASRFRSSSFLRSCRWGAIDHWDFAVRIASCSTWIRRALRSASGSASWHRNISWSERPTKGIPVAVWLRMARALHSA